MLCQWEKLKRSYWGWLAFDRYSHNWRGHCLPDWCWHIHIMPVRKAKTKLLRMVSIHPGIDGWGYCLPDVGISTSCQWEKPKRSYWGWWAFILELMDEGIAYLMSAYPRHASEKRFFDEAVLGRDSFKLMGGITCLMSAYPRCACSPDVGISTSCQWEKQSCCWGWLTLIQSMRELCTWCQHIHVMPARKIVAKKLQLSLMKLLRMFIKRISYFVDLHT